MQLFKIHTGLIKPNQDIIKEIILSLDNSQINIENNDILAITSKIISLSQGRIVKLEEVKPSDLALKLSKKYNLDPEYVELIIQEADEIYGGTDQAICTLKEGVMIANSGIDRKNVPSGYAVLSPANPYKSAQKIRQRIYDIKGKFVGVVIVDSRVTPLRLGTVGVAFGFSGFIPVRDCRGFKDLYDKPLHITRHCQVDDLAGAAHLVMGEVDERVPAILIRDAPITISYDLNSQINKESVMVSPNRCLFINALKNEKETK
jgi:coenzyme F420-0:L-glutamate ligase/coenzyme F420-1:gamma-L-glutamate ligase